MTNYPRLHRALVLLGAIQSLLVGLALLISPASVLALVFTADSTQILTIHQVEILLSLVGVLLIFYAFVMFCVAICFDNKSIRVKAGGELISGVLFLWLAVTYSKFLVITLMLLAFQHIAVGLTYLVTTNKFQQ